MSLMDLNLLPSSAKFQAAKVQLWKKVNRVIIWIVAAWVVAAAVIFGLLLITNLRITAAESQFKKAQNDYISLADNIITSQTLKYRAKIVGGILSSRFEYGKAFGEMTNLFPTEVEVTNYQLVDKGGFQMTMTTTGSENMNKVEAVVEDINNNLNDNFKSAKMTTLSYKGGKWLFIVEVKLK